MTKYRIKSASWWSVLLAILPGILMLFSRSGVGKLELPLMLLGFLYLALLLIGLPMMWRHQRKFPAWGLLPAGLLAWFLVYFAATLLAQLSTRLQLNPRLFNLWSWVSLLQFLLAVILLVLLLRGRRLPTAFWQVTGIILILNLLMAVYYSQERFGNAQLLSGILMYFAGSGIGPLEGFMLVGIGLLAVRQHAELALLLVAGGYGYMLMDSDYLFGSAVRTWPGLPLYFLCLILIYLVLMPAAALWARSSLGRFLGVFVPVLLFHLARISVPSLVLQRSLHPALGEVVLSANMILSLLLAWTLYRQTDSELQLEDKLAEDIFLEETEG